MCLVSREVNHINVGMVRNMNNLVAFNMSLNCQSKHVFATLWFAKHTHTHNKDINPKSAERQNNNEQSLQILKNPLSLA